MAQVPITATSIKKQVYSVSGTHGCLENSNPSPTHHLFLANDCRITETWTVDAKYHTDHTLVGAKDPNGSIYYLPYGGEAIYSMRLPGNPPPACRKFLTANMSGCRFFADTITGSNDVIVYHANTGQHSLGAGAAANSQAPAAEAILVGLHNTAKADYANKNPAVIAVNHLDMRKYEYAMAGEQAAMRKRAQGRQATVLGPDPNNHGGWAIQPGVPDFMGGTTICGFFNNGWRFYYQTWGYISYDRTGGAAEVAKSLVTLHWNKVHKLRTLKTKSSTEKKVLHDEEIV